MADKKMAPAAGARTTVNHVSTSPVKPGFIGVFYWQWQTSRQLSR